MRRCPGWFFEERWSLELVHGFMNRYPRGGGLRSAQPCVQRQTLAWTGGFSRHGIAHQALPLGRI